MNYAGVAVAGNIKFTIVLLMISWKDIGIKVPLFHQEKLLKMIVRFKESGKVEKNIAILDYISQNIRAGVTTEQINQPDMIQ